MTSVFAFLFGSAVGSFLNVCIYRLPKEESVVTPRSRCPARGATIRAVDNIPLLSLALLRGRCHACGNPISWRYPLVEALRGILFALTVTWFGITLQAVFLLTFLCGLVVVSFIDLDQLIIPNAITLPGIPLGLLAGLFLGKPPAPGSGDRHTARCRVPLPGTL